MSPVRGPDNGPSQDGALRYAPRKSRLGESVTQSHSRDSLSRDPGHSPLGLPRAEFDAVAPAPVGRRLLDPSRPGEPPRTAGAPPRVAGSPRAPGRQPAAAAGGSTAVVRTRQALQPRRLAQPPRSSGASVALTWAGRVTGVAVVVAVGFTGYRWGSVPPPAAPVGPLALPAAVPAKLLPAATLSTTAVQPRSQDAGPATGQTVVNAVPVMFSPADKNALPPPPKLVRQQLTVGTVPALQADAAVRLPVSAGDATPRSVVVIGGMAPGTTVSAGQPVTPTAWRLTVKDLPVKLTPPPGYVGAMALSVELHGLDGGLTDRAGLRLEWQRKNAPAPVAAPAKPRVQHDPSEIAQIMRRGDDLMKTGDAASARLMYQRAAETGDATAAFKLAETYDPLVRSIGLAPDPDRAHRWYVKARDLGSPQAAERLDRLARFDQ